MTREASIVRHGGEAKIIIVPEAEFGGWPETIHLLGNPANATRLLPSIRSADAGIVREHDLIEGPASAAGER
nr:hypothetical protein [uncultured Rhodopila sp.]